MMVDPLNLGLMNLHFVFLECIVSGFRKLLLSVEKLIVYLQWVGILFIRI